MCWG